MKKRSIKRKAKSIKKKVTKAVKRNAKRVSFRELDFKVGKMNVQITRGGKKGKK